MTNDMTRVVKQLELVSDALAEATKQNSKLWDLIEEIIDSGPRAPGYKDDRGNLTESGVLKLEKMLAERATNSQIARFFDISTPAVIYRRNRWLASKARAATA